MIKAKVQVTNIKLNKTYNYLEIYLANSEQELTDFLNRDENTVDGELTYKIMSTEEAKLPRFLGSEKEPK